MNKDSQKNFQELEPGDEIILDDFNDEQAPQEPIVSVNTPKPKPKDIQSPPPPVDDNPLKTSAPESIEDNLATQELKTIFEPEPAPPPVFDPVQKQTSSALEEKSSDSPTPDPLKDEAQDQPPAKEAVEPVIPPTADPLPPVDIEPVIDRQPDAKIVPQNPAPVPPLRISDPLKDEAQDQPPPAKEAVEPVIPPTADPLPPVDIEPVIDRQPDAKIVPQNPPPVPPLQIPDPSLDSVLPPAASDLEQPPWSPPQPAPPADVNRLSPEPAVSQPPPEIPPPRMPSPEPPRSIDPILPVKAPEKAEAPQADTSSLAPPPAFVNSTQEAATAQLAPPPTVTSPNAAFEADLDKLIKPPPPSAKKAKETKPLQNIPKVSRTFLAFCFLTCCIFLGTIIAVLIRFWPNINNVFQSQNQQETNQFEDVLAHLLQVENQNVEISFVSEEDQDILPHLEGDNIVLAEISMTNDVQLSYFNEDFTPHFNANLDFDLQLQGSSSSNNILLAFSTLFEDEEAYFKIDKFCIDDCSGLRLDDQYLQRWSDLGLLLQSGQTSGGLTENNSRILSYLVTLFNEYPTYRYLVLLPVFNIVSSQQYIETKKLLLESQIYNLNSGGCRQIKAQEMSCPLTINYVNLYNFYQRAYVEVLEKQLPSHYTILENLQLTNKFEIVFDTKEHTPLRLTAVNNQFDLNINYSKFDSISFDLESPTSLVSLLEYYQQILKAEEQIYVQ